MDILLFNTSYSQIPKQDLPQVGEHCLIICKQEYSQPPKINTGEWEVLEWSPDELNDGIWGVSFIGLFWELEYAKLMAAAILSKLETESK